MPKAKPAPIKERAVLSVDEVADILRMSRTTVYKYVRNGEIPTRRLGNRILISKKLIYEWLQNGKPATQIPLQGPQDAK